MSSSSPGSVRISAGAGACAAPTPCCPPPTPARPSAPCPATSSTTYCTSWGFPTPPTSWRMARPSRCRARSTLPCGTGTSWISAATDKPGWRRWSPRRWPRSPRWAKGLDIELLALLLRKRTRVYDVSLEEPPEEPEGTFWPTPDRLFILDLLGDEDQQRVTLGLLEALYRSDHQWTRRVLVGTRGDLDSELEEHAFRWRSGRMADLGFPDYYEALEVYREIDPATRATGRAARPPRAAAVGPVRSRLPAHALGAGRTPDRERSVRPGGGGRQRPAAAGQPAGGAGRAGQPGAGRRSHLPRRRRRRPPRRWPAPPPPWTWRSSSSRAARPTRPFKPCGPFPCKGCFSSEPAWWARFASWPWRCCDGPPTPS